jgi:hypothetical protein
VRIAVRTNGTRRRGHVPPAALPHHEPGIYR